MDEQNEVKLFGQGGLIFDPTNPLDYLLAVPAVGLTGQGIKLGAKAIPKAFQGVRQSLFSPKITAGPNPAVMVGTQGPLGPLVNNPIVNLARSAPLSTTGLAAYGYTKLPENGVLEAQNQIPEQDLLKVLEDVNIEPSQELQSTINNINMDAINFQRQTDLLNLPGANVSPSKPVVSEPVKPENNFTSRKNQQLASMLFALSDVLKGKDPSPGVITRQQILKQEQSQAEQIRRLREAGLSESAINLFLGGASLKDAIFYDKQIKSRVQTQEVSDILSEAEQLTQDEEEGLSLIKEAYGGGDTIENAILSVVNPFINFDTDTRKAIAQKQNFTERLRNLYTQDYTGRPSVYTQQRINEILPVSSFMSETDAFNAYKAIEGDLVRAENDLLRESQSDAYSPKERQELLTQLRQTRSMLSKLEIVTNALRPEESLKTQKSRSTQSIEEAENIFLGS